MYGMQYLAAFLGVYFAIGVFFDFFTLGAITFSTFQYSTNTESFIAAVQEVGSICCDGGSRELLILFGI